MRCPSQLFFLPVVLITLGFGSTKLAAQFTDQPQPAADQNILKNGDFSSGDLSGWRGRAGKVVYLSNTGEIVPDRAAGSDPALVIELSNRAQEIEQRFRIPSRVTEFILLYRARLVSEEMSSAKIDGSLEARAGDLAGYSLWLEVPQGGEWTPFFLPLKLPARMTGSATLTLTFPPGSGQLFLDDIYIISREDFEREPSTQQEKFKLPNMPDTKE